MKKILLVMIVVLLLGVGAVSAQTDDNPVILLQGRVMGFGAEPVVGAMVEIWQTDANGNYFHPNAPNQNALLNDFQYFGTAVTDEQGYFAFRTVIPGEYEPRPVHIHFKVFIDGQEVLTSQYYFADDQAEIANDGVVLDAFGGDIPYLVTDERTDADGNTVTVATGDIILPMGEGQLIPTASQAEGPFYPTVDFTGYDNDLTSTADGDAIVLPILVEAREFTLLNLNTASGDDLLTIPDVGNRMVREFQEYRPYISILQFRREIGKYVDEAQVAAYEAYVYVPINVDESDAATLMQIPGINEGIADALIAARPFGSNEAFLAALGEYLSPTDAAFAENYLAAE